MALLGATKLAKAMINVYCDILLISYYFATQVYTDCKIFIEFMKIVNLCQFTTCCPNVLTDKPFP